jgi:uncharacterized membrane protein YgcG
MYILTLPNPLLATEIDDHTYQCLPAETQILYHLEPRYRDSAFDEDELDTNCNNDFSGVADAPLVNEETFFGLDDTPDTGGSDSGCDSGSGFDGFGGGDAGGGGSSDSW